MALVPEHDKCAGYFKVGSIISECIDQGEDPYAEGPVATNVRPFRISGIDPECLIPNTICSSEQLITWRVQRSPRWRVSTLGLSLCRKSVIVIVPG